MHVRPAIQDFTGLLSKRASSPLGFLGQQRQDLRDFLLAHPSRECDQSQFMPIHSLGEAPQKRVFAVRRHAFDDELISGNRDHQVASQTEQRRETNHDLSQGRAQGGMPRRVH